MSGREQESLFSTQGLLSNVGHVRMPQWQLVAGMAELGGAICRVARCVEFLARQLVFFLAVRRLAKLSWQSLLSRSVLSTGFSFAGQFWLMLAMIPLRAVRHATLADSRWFAPFQDPSPAGVLDLEL